MDLLTPPHAPSPHALSPHAPSPHAPSPHAPSPLALALLAAAGAMAGCVPELEDRTSLVTTPRVLAVAAEPAEATLGQRVRYTALWADPGGAAYAPSLQWAFCTDPVPLDRIDPVSPRCLQPAAEWLVPLGEGLEVEGTLPADGCRRFGPNPGQTPGEPPVRPVDPDASGGYYQPVRALVSSPDATGYVSYRSRIRCGVAGASQAQAAELLRRSRPNANPVVASLELADGRRLTRPDEDPPYAVTAGEPLVLRVRWERCPPCGETCPDAGCGGAESYLLFDPVVRQVVERREGIRVSWFASGGRFANERTAVAPESSAPSASENGWTAPLEPGEVRLWVVLRDDRGGVGWGEYRVRVSGPRR